MQKQDNTAFNAHYNNVNAHHNIVNDNHSNINANHNLVHAHHSNVNDNDNHNKNAITDTTLVLNTNISRRDMLLLGGGIAGFLCSAIPRVPYSNEKLSKNISHSLFDVQQAWAQENAQLKTAETNNSNTHNSTASQTSTPWEAPEITELSSNSNLFVPGDRPAPDCIAFCTEINTSVTGGSSRSYWGSDYGLSYLNAHQKNWPLRNHSFGLDCFNYQEASTGNWHCRTIDPYSGNILENNKNNCGREGYESHHITSYAIWNISEFNNELIPNTAGTFNLHNNTGHLYGAYGMYKCLEFPNGIMPPDNYCCTVGLVATATITCFSVQALPCSEGYQLLYCLYVFVNTNEQSESAQTTLDNYAGTVWACAMAAGIEVNVHINNFANIGIQLAKNIYRCLFHGELPGSLEERVSNYMSHNECSVGEALEKNFSTLNWKTHFSNAEQAVSCLYRSITGNNIPPSEIAHWSAQLQLNSLSYVMRTMLETLTAQSRLSFPNAVPSFTCTIEEKDCANQQQKIHCNYFGQGKSLLSFNRGTYTGKLSGITRGWNLENPTSQTTIPDTGSGQHFPLRFTATATIPPDVYPEITVTYYRDAIACNNAGLDPLCYTHTANYLQWYKPPVEANNAGKRNNCSKWLGWYTDAACTNAYEPHVLQKSLKLYCQNFVQLQWELSNNSKRLLEKHGTRFSTNNNFTDTVSLEELMPHNELMPWLFAYDKQELCTIWWKTGNESRSSEGHTCFDQEGQQRIDNALILQQNTTLYADWKPLNYDGITAS